MKTENLVRIGQLATNLETQEIMRPDLVAELKAIFIAETGENPWAKPIEDMTPSHLDYLSDTFLSDGDNFADFQKFWLNFLSEEPEPDEMAKLLKKIRGWGYVVDDED